MSKFIEFEKILSLDEKLTRNQIFRKMGVSKSEFRKIEQKYLIKQGFTSYEMTSRARSLVAQWCNLQTHKYSFNDVKGRLVPFLCDVDISTVKNLGISTKNCIYGWVLRHCDDPEKIRHRLPGTAQHRLKMRVIQIEKSIEKNQAKIQKLRKELEQKKAMLNV